jgi:hypothetical protein
VVGRNGRSDELERTCDLKDVVGNRGGKQSRHDKLENLMCPEGAMRDSTADTREDVVRTRGVQDHEAGPFTKFIFWRTKRRYGHVLLSTRIRANDPKLLALAELMSRYMSTPGALAPKLKELVQLKVAAMVGCPF